MSVASVCPQTAAVSRLTRWLTIAVCCPQLVGQIHDPKVDGAQAVVVYNRRLPESRALAEYYAAVRGIPPVQVLGFDLPTTEVISRAEFRDQIQEPLLAALRDRGLFTPSPDQPLPAQNGQPIPWLRDAKVRYLTLCYGVPLKITRDPELIEAARDSLPEPLRRNEAAVDSELALLPANLASLPAVGPLANPAFGQTNLARLHPTNGVWAVGRIDGPTAAIARGLIDKAVEAETNGLWGRAYVDLRGLTNTPALAGDQWLGGFGQILRRTGYETIIDAQPTTFPAAFPMSQIAFYAGWYDAEASGPFTRKSVEFMPGAIVYHLHSFNALSIRTANRHWVGPLLAKGATATMGSVEEPYLELTPNTTTFAALLTGLGYSFGEAALASQPALSWQITVVGDPLYRPFGVFRAGEHIGLRFARLHTDLAARQDPLLSWAFLQMANFQLASGQEPAQLAAELEPHPQLRVSSILREKLGSLFFEMGKLGDALRAYERALNLDTSPQQKTRLLLTIAQLQGLYGREKQALEQYERLLREIPDYPDQLGLYRLMLPLAQQLNATDKLEQIQGQIDRLSQPPVK
ncbi:MAG: TIGR03790 family protein [Verrucomicrobia bacterium]|nr:TIGR03790 family protein [Verrucomicrobiota bacterium]